LYRSGGRPLWYKSDPNYDPIWDFVADYCTEDYDVFVVAGPEEWCKMMDAFKYFSFNIAGFEILRKWATSGFSPSSCCRKTYYFILFGPLALCNSSNDVTVRFYNIDNRDGSLRI